MRMLNAIRSFEYRAEHVILVVLMTLTALSLAGIYFHPAFLAPAITFGVLALAVYQINWRHKLHRARRIASSGGAHGPVTHTGTIVHMSGVCLSGVSMHKGQEFSVADGRVWPHLCVHAEAAITEAMPRLRQHTEPLWPAPIHYGDADHAFDLSLQDIREESEAA